MTIPIAYLVVGPAGSGKSTVARSLAASTGAAYLDKDTIAGPLVELLLSERGDDPWERDENTFYQERIFPLEYGTLFAVAADNLRLGRPVVLDAPFRRYTGDPDYLQRARAEAEWPDARAIVVHVEVSDPVHRARVAARANPRDSWKLAHWDEFRAHLLANPCAWRGAEHVTVRNDGDEPELAAVLG